MALARVFNVILRLAELVFAAIVAGITGWILHFSNENTPEIGRWIYTEVIAAITIIVALIWLVPFSASFINWPFDLLLAICWFVAFGIIVNLIGDSCGYVFNWGNVSPDGDHCGKIKADIAFTFLLAICFLASALIGAFWVRSREREIRQGPVHRRRRGWYGRRSHV